MKGVLEVNNRLDQQTSDRQMVKSINSSANRAYNKTRLRAPANIEY